MGYRGAMQWAPALANLLLLRAEANGLLCDRKLGRGTPRYASAAPLYLLSPSHHIIAID